MTVGEKIKKKRTEKGLTQSALGNLCGIHSEMVRHYELGLRNPKLSTLTKFATHLDVSPSYFLDLDPDAYTLLGKALGFEYKELKNYAKSLDLNVPQFIISMLAQGFEVELAKLQKRDPSIFNPELAETVEILNKLKTADNNSCDSDVPSYA